MAVRSMKRQPIPISIDFLLDFRNQQGWKSVGHLLSLNLKLDDAAQTARRR